MKVTTAGGPGAGGGPVIGALLAAFAILGSTVTAAAGREAVDLARIQAAIAAPRVVEHARRIDALDAAGAVDSLAAEIERIDPSSAIAQDWLLDRLLHALARHRPTNPARHAVERVTLRSARIFVRVEPESASTVPFLDPAATARFTLRAWDRAAARDAALAQLTAGSSAPIERYAALDGHASNDATRAGIVEALAAAPVATLARVRAPVVSALERGARVDEAALTVASRLRDRALLELVIGYADPIVALKAVRSARASLGDTDSLQLLMAAAQRPEVASAAVLEIGDLARDSDQAREHLFAALVDPAIGPSAAAALGGLRDVI